MREDKVSTKRGQQWLKIFEIIILTVEMNFLKLSREVEYQDKHKEQINQLTPEGVSEGMKTTLGTKDQNPLQPQSNSSSRRRE